MRKPAIRPKSAARSTAPTKAPAPAKARKSASTTPPTQGLPDKAERSDALHVKVTAAFKQRFKQAAKDQGLKKAAFLEKLLADWQARQPAAATVVAPPAARPAKTGKAPGRAVRTRKA